MRSIPGLIAALCAVIGGIAVRAQDVESFSTLDSSQVALPSAGFGFTPAGFADLFSSKPDIAPATPEPWSLDGQTPYVQRFGVAYDGGSGLGWQRGMTTLEFMTPLRGDLVWENLFLDVRAVLLNDSTTAANVGIGQRWYNLDQNRIYGLNAFFDYRNTGLNEFRQLGLGFESLGALVDFRANAYIPDVGGVIGTVPNLFVGHRMITNRDEIAMTGGDVEAGLCLFDTDRFQSRIFGGGYYLNGHRNPDATGWKARAEATLDQQVWVDALIQHDQVFGTTASIGVAIRYLKRQLPPSVQALKPMDHIFFRRRGDASGKNIAYRLSAPIERLQTVVYTRDPVVATDPGGTPLNFLHVVPGAAGTGTIENPYGTLSAALADAAAGTSIIYTPQGGAFVENVTLVAGAQVLSNGPIQRVQTQFGSTKLPFSGAGSVFSNLPTIQGNVAMANNSRFSGFSVTGEVSATGVSGFTIDNTKVTFAAGDALVITGAGSATLDNLNVQSTVGRGLFLNDSSADVKSLTVANAGGNGVEITTTATNRTVTMQNLTVTKASTHGVDVNVTGAGSLALSITGTNAVTSTSNAFDAGLAGGSTGNLDLGLNGATLTSTAGRGINLDGTAGTGTLFVSSFANNVIAQATGGGLIADTVTFDADPTTGAIETVNAGTWTIGASTTPPKVTGDGVRLVDPSGALNFTTLDIFNSTGTGLLVNTKGGGTTFDLTTGPTSTIVTTTGTAISLDPLNVNLAFDLVQSTAAPTHGVFIDTVTGNITIGGTTINNSVGTSIVIQNTPPSLSVNFGSTVIKSTISDSVSDNVDTSVGNGTNLNVTFDPLTITGP